MPLGGEEFAAYFPNGDVDFEAADVIRKAFEENDFVMDDIRIPQRISVGAVRMKRASVTSLEHLSGEADRCLYEAKETGRNKTIFREIN